MILENSYCSFVNLDSRPDRLNVMKQTLARAGIQATRTRGMLPSEYKGDLAKIRCMLNRPQKGAIGCHFSQVSIMEEALRRKRHAFVMEDDLVFCSDFKERMAIIDNYCKAHPWDVIWLGGTFHINPPYWHKANLGRDAELTTHPRIIRTYGAFSTHAYIVNGGSIAKILMMIDFLLPLSMGIDWAFIQIQPRLYTYAFVPGCIKQLDGESNIGVNRDGSPGFTRFSSFSKLGKYWYQDNMCDFDPATYDWHEAKR